MHGDIRRAHRTSTKAYFILLRVLAANIRGSTRSKYSEQVSKKLIPIIDK